RVEHSRPIWNSGPVRSRARRQRDQERSAMLRRMAAVALAGAVGGARALAGPAQATGLTQEPISVTTEVVGKCGPIILTAQWNIESGQTDNAKLVVFDGTDVKVAGIGTPIEVGPFDK